MDFAILPDQDFASLWLRNISLVDVSEKGGSGGEEVGERDTVTSLASDALVKDLLNGFLFFLSFPFFPFFPFSFLTHCTYAQ